MKALVIAFTLVLIAPAASQPYPWPQTMKLYNNANGEVVGTATKWANKFTLRDMREKLIGTLVIEKDGTRIFYDPNGQQVDNLPFNVPDEP
jgi:hypothetical protein